MCVCVCVYGTKKKRIWSKFYPCPYLLIFNVLFLFRVFSYLGYLEYYFVYILIVTLTLYTCGADI